MRASRSTSTRAGRNAIGRCVAALGVTGGLVLAGLPAVAAPADHAADVDPGATIADETTTDTPSLVTDLRVRVDAKAGAATAAREYLGDNTERFHIAAPQANLDVESTTSTGGEEVVRLQQQYEGVDVLGGQYVVRMEKQGGTRTVTGTSGKYYTDLDLDTVEAKVSAQTAIERAVAAVAASRYGQAPLSKAAAERLDTATPPLAGTSEGLVVLPQGSGVLTRHVSVTGVSPVDGTPVQQDVYVDAHSGFPLLQLDTFSPFLPAGATGSAEGATGTAPAAAAPAATQELVVKGSGTRYDGEQVDLNLYRGTDGALQTIDYSKRPAATPYSGTMIATYDARGVEAQFASGAWPAGVKTFRPAGPELGQEYTDAGAVDAHWAAGKVYDYYKNHFGRESIDGKAGFIYSFVGVTANGQPYNNAFWDGTKMVYGQGGGDFRTFSADTDVVGHEMTHGVVEHSAGLVYAGQSGAINEALADYFGNAIDLEANDLSMDDPDAGLIGEDLCTKLGPRECALRDLNDGATTFDDLVGVTYGGDSGGVHLNSTIFGGALWDVREDLGAELGDQIAYRAMTAYMTPLDGFLEGRDAVVAAAEELGATAAQVKAVKGHFAAHGIIPGWEDAIGVDTTTLIAQNNVAGTGVGAGGGTYAVSRSSEDGSEPYSVWVGNTNGKGEPRLVSPNNGDYNVYADTDGTTVVWATYAADGIRVFARPVAGGVTKFVGAPGGPVSALAVDGDLVTFQVTDPTTGYQHVGYFELSTGRRALVDPGTPPFQTALPSVRDGKVAYARLWPGSAGYELGVEVLDVASGTKQLMPVDPSAVQAVGQTTITDDGVFWIQDDDVTDAGQAAVMRADADGTDLRTITPESGKRSLFAYSLTGSDDAITVTSVPPAMTWANDTLPKLYQVSPEGGKAAQRMTCNRGEQVFATADTGKRVLWFDGTTGFTDLVTRTKPAGQC